MNCRFCKTALTDVFIDLGHAPASNSFLSATQLNEPETYFPLKVYTCSQCFLVQIDEYKKSDAIFDNDYVYFSSYSSSWLQHAKKYVDEMEARFGLNPNHLVIEIASNDGYLLQYFQQKAIPVLGIEPTANTAEVAAEKGIPSVVEFFGVTLAKKLVAQGTRADLLLGNNVLAHVPDISDFVAGMKLLLQEKGVITMEFPHLMQLVNNHQFDTIYHEHFSYLSLYTVKQIFEANGLDLFDVTDIPTHGGSLRIFAKHQGDTSHEVTNHVSALLAREKETGLQNSSYYRNFQETAFQIKTVFLQFLIEQRLAGKKVAAYGAAAKGNTLLNYCGVKNDFIDFVVDANPHKQGKFLPGSHIPVFDEARLKAAQPDYVIILPWNIQEEIMEQLKYIQDWGGQFVTAIPQFEIHSA